MDLHVYARIMNRVADPAGDHNGLMRAFVAEVREQLAYQNDANQLAILPYMPRLPR